MRIAILFGMSLSLSVYVSFCSLLQIKQLIAANQRMVSGQEAFATKNQQLVAEIAALQKNEKAAFIEGEAIGGGGVNVEQGGVLGGFGEQVASLEKEKEELQRRLGEKDKEMMETIERLKGSNEELKRRIEGMEKEKEKEEQKASAAAAAASSVAGLEKEQGNDSSLTLLRMIQTSGEVPDAEGWLFKAQPITVLFLFISRQKRRCS